MNDSEASPAREQAPPDVPRGLVRTAHEPITVGKQEGFRGSLTSLWEIADDEDEEPEDVLK
jgi:hypothetical protein